MDLDREAPSTCSDEINGYRKRKFMTVDVLPRLLIDVESLSKLLRGRIAS